MAGFNRVIIIGNLTRDPDYKQLTSGQGVCRLGLATNRQFKNRQTGAMVQEVCYIDIDVWGAQAESCRQYLQKGRAVLIEGRIKLDSCNIHRCFCLLAGYGDSALRSLFFLLLG